jgi:hypothetical protein
LLSFEEKLLKKLSSTYRLLAAARKLARGKMASEMKLVRVEHLIGKTRFETRYA